MLSIKPPMPYPKKREGSDFPVVAVHANNLHEPTDAFIGKLKEGQETILTIDPDSLTVMSVLQRDFESRLLPSNELTRFSDNPKNCPDFIQCFKEQVYCKNSFSGKFIV